MRRVRRAQQHAVGLDPPHVPRLEVAEGDDEAVTHLVDRDVLDEPGDDGAGLRLAEVDGLDVEADVLVLVGRVFVVIFERDKGGEREGGRRSRWSVVAVVRLSPPSEKSIPFFLLVSPPSLTLYSL